MASRFDWFPWHRNYRTDDWFLSLSDDLRWTWVAFLSWANEFDWRPPKCSFKILASNIWATESNVELLLRHAMSHDPKKVIDEGENWFVVNGPKYSLGRDTTSAERQARYRKNKKLNACVTDSNSNVTASNVTSRLQDRDSNSDNTETITETRQKKRTKTVSKSGYVMFSDIPQKVQSFILELRELNSRYPRSFVDCKDDGMYKAVLDRLLLRMDEPKWDSSAIVRGIASSEFYRGDFKGDRGYFRRPISWLLEQPVGKDPNYVRLVDLGKTAPDDDREDWEKELDRECIWNDPDWKAQHGQ